MARSPDVNVPVVVGFVRPVVLLPTQSLDWDEERLRTVLLHEAAHVRRRDGVALLVASVAAALYWFLPLAWIMVRRLRRECELAADEDVLQEGMRATAYAGHLLAVAREASVGAFVVAMARPSELEERVRALVSRERLPVRLTRRRTTFASAGAALLLVFAACADAAPRGAEAPPTRATASGVDPAARGILADEARRAKAEWGASRVALVALAPRTGAVVAMVDDDPGRPILPASTLKPIVVAAALDASAITAEEKFDCGQGTRDYDSAVYGKRTLRDWKPFGVLDTGEILAMSSNIGISRVFDALGGDRLARALRRFRLNGAPAVIENGSFEGAVLSLGHAFRTTPLELAAAYGVLANDGRYVAPGLDRGVRAAEPVIAEGAASAVRRMLVTAVSGERATGHGARIDGITVAGKTGTSDESEPVASFVGIVPAEPPRFVILAAVVGAKKEGSGGTIAAPLFARVAKRLLTLPAVASRD